MPSKLGKYILVRTLGSGASSKVKYALDTTTNKPYAIKIINNDYAYKENLELFQTEVKILQKLEHDNIIKYVEHDQQGIKEKKERKMEVSYIVFELGQGGLLYDFIKLSGAFQENVARYYFRQMIEAIEYMHSKIGLVHRDLKPGNILLDNEFNIKIADFGFATSLAGKENNYFLKTKLGTEKYKAPEILQGKPYHGDQVDLFALGVILFNLVTTQSPFNLANDLDSFYNSIAKQRSDAFWQNHTSKTFKNNDYLSMDLKNLITHMIQLEPIYRLTLSEIKAHPWYQKEVPTHQQICEEFKERKKLISEKQQLSWIHQKKLEDAYKLRHTYKAIDNEQDISIEQQSELKLDEYIPLISTQCELFSDQAPNLLYKALLNCLEYLGMIGENV